LAQESGVILGKQPGSIVLPKYFSWLVLFPGVVALAAVWPTSSSYASDSTRAPSSIKSNFHHSAWTSKNGAPADIRAITQTPDGWLWLGTPSGLYRFDGVNFDTIPLRPPSSTATRSVLALLAAHNGDLWISLAGGDVEVMRHGDPQDIVAEPGLTVNTQAYYLFQDDWGDLWASTNAGALVHKNNTWGKPDPSTGFPTQEPSGYTLDGAGNFWVGTAAGAWVMRKGTHRFEHETTNIPAGQLFALFSSNDGQPWVFSQTSVYPLLSQKVKPPQRLSHMQPQGRPMVVTGDASIWTTYCDTGLCRALGSAQSPLHHFPQKFVSDQFNKVDGLTSVGPRVLYEDAEGTVWVGTPEGLDSFRHNDFVEVTFPNIIRNFQLAPSNDGSLWAGSNANLPSDADFLWHLDPQPAKVDAYKAGRMLALFREKNGDVLMGSSGSGILRYSKGRVEKAALPAAPQSKRVVGFIRDGEGKLWSSFDTLGLYRLDGNAWTRNGGLAELPSTQPNDMVLAPDGRLWLSFGAEDVRVVAHDHVQTITSKNGLHIGVVSAISPGEPALLGGNFGVSLWTHGSWHTLNADHPEALMDVTGIGRSGDGATWLNGRLGAVRIAPGALAEATSDPTSVVHVRVMGDEDGLSGSAQDLAESIVQTTDGKLWFAQSASLAWLDSERLRLNSRVPSIVVRSISSAAGEVPTSGPVILPAKTTNVRFAYTALSLADAGKNRFMILLDGVDSDWQDMGTRREVGYTNLGPGRYRFRVKGSNNDGVWNEKGAELIFRIKPTFYQTSWFLALEILAGLVVLYFLFRLLLGRSMARERDRMEIRHAERERIARDLHDSFLQVVSYLLLRFDRIGQGMQPGERARLHVDETLDHAQLALADGRDRVSALRDNVLQPTNIEAFLNMTGNELSRDFPATCSVRVQGRRRKVRADVADEISAIGKEALSNAFRHAEASHVDVHIQYGWRRFRMIVRDDGKGLPEVVEHDNGREGHWGLVGMAERASTIGGTLRVRRHPNGGTEVTLSVPGRALSGK
jgi:signal transduction histidine kinase/ligand-binding sensor domain-containing protein